MAQSDIVSTRTQDQSQLTIVALLVYAPAADASMMQGPAMSVAPPARPVNARNQIPRARRVNSRAGLPFGIVDITPCTWGANVVPSPVISDRKIPGIIQLTRMPYLIPNIA